MPLTQYWLWGSLCDLVLICKMEILTHHRKVLMTSFKSKGFIQSFCVKVSNSDDIFSRFSASVDNFSVSKLYADVCAL